VDGEAFARSVPREYKGILNLEVLPKEKGMAEEAFLEEAYGVISEIEGKIKQN